MITEKFFVSTLNKMKNMSDDVAAINEAINNTILRNDFFDAEFMLNPELFAMLVDTLDQALDPDDQWVSWWVFDTNFGRGETESSVFAVSPVIVWNDIKHNLDTPEKLFDFITNWV